MRQWIEGESESVRRMTLAGREARVTGEACRSAGVPARECWCEEGAGGLGVDRSAK